MRSTLRVKKSKDFAVVFGLLVLGTLGVAASHADVLRNS